MRTTKKLYQWDTNQKLIDCVGKYVDYPIGDEVYRIEAIDKECIIPDELLQVSGTVKVYECMEYGTVKAFAFYINPRPMPPDYVFTPTQRLTFEGLVKKVDETIEDLQKRADSGEFNGSDYVITESDYDAIAAKTAGKLQPTIGELERTLETEKADREQADISLQKDISGKLSEPAEGIAAGKYFRVAQIDENGHAVLEAVDAKTIGVQDVQVNGESIVAGENGVADLPLATNTKLGLVTSAGSNYGIGISEGLASLNLAAQNEIYARTTRKVISPQNIDYAVKAAMCDGKGAAWTAEEQAAARERMAVENGSDFELLVDATLEEEANTFTVVFPRAVRECMYHIWFFNNNGTSVIAQTRCIDVDNTDSCLLKHSAGVADVRGYILNGYFRYNGKITGASIIGYASESTSPGWTSDDIGNGGDAYMSYPTARTFQKVDGLSFRLLDGSHVLNAGTTIKVWGR